MFTGLGHGAVIGGNHQQGKINAGDPGQHVADKTFVTGNIDKSKHGSIIQRVIGKAQVNGQTARLFFGQAVGINAG